MATFTPQSQKADTRPISFLLVDQTGPDPISPSRSVTLYIRPEELTRPEPSRALVPQTLTGAWLDNFGEGLAPINISGHLGWRRSDGTDGLDGEGRFRALREKVYVDWHARQKDAVRAGRDPGQVKLIFADALDGFAVVVAPLTFTLRRSRSRPLLMQYQISLIVLDQNIDQRVENPSSLGVLGDLQPMGLDSLIRSVDQITERIKTIQNDIDRTIAAPVAKFMQTTARLYRSVDGAIRAADGVAGSLITVARLTSQAGLNIFRTAAAIVGIPALAKARLMQIAGAYSNIFCVLRNAINQQLFVPDYSPLFGSSNCSSTNGGRPPSPLSGVNPFYLVSPTTSASPVAVTSGAQRNLQMLAANDVVLSPLTTQQLGDAVTQITDGLVVA